MLGTFSVLSGELRAGSFSLNRVRVSFARCGDDTVAALQEILGLGIDFHASPAPSIVSFQIKLGTDEIVDSPLTLSSRERRLSRSSFSRRCCGGLASREWLGELSVDVGSRQARVGGTQLVSPLAASVCLSFLLL